MLTTLRGRFLILCIAATVLPAAVLVVSAVMEHSRLAEPSERHATRLAEFAALDLRAALVEARDTLDRAAANVAPYRDLGQRCRETERAARKSSAMFSAIILVGPLGGVQCPLDTPHAVVFSDRNYFQRMLASQEVTLGVPLVGRVTGRTVIPIAQPLPEQSDSRSALLAGIDIGWLTTQIRTGMALQEAVVVLLGSDGQVLGRTVRGPTDAPGAGSGALYAFSAGTNVGPGAETQPNVDVASMPVALDAEPILTALAAVSVEPVMPVESRQLITQLVVIASTGVLIFATGWASLDRLVLQPIGRLASMARAIARGDVSARAGNHGVGELAEVGLLFDHMAQAVAQREEMLTGRAVEIGRLNRALRTLSAGNQALLRVSDEQVFLQTFCNILVEIGGHRMAWVGYVCADEPGRPVRPMAHAGMERTFISGPLSRLRLDDDRSRDGPVMAAIRDQTIVISDDIGRDPRFPAWAKATCDQGYVSYIGLPLTVDGEVIGGLGIFSSQIGTFGAEERDLLEETAADLSFGIEVIRHRARRLAAEKHLLWLAHHDPALHLPNRAGMAAKLSEMLEAAVLKGEPLVIAKLEINRLAELETAFGPARAMALRKLVARHLQSVLPPAGVLGTHGTELFAVLLPCTDLAAGVETIQRMSATLDEPLVVEELTVDVQLSAGVALFPLHGEGAEDLRRRALVALRAARAGGGPQVYEAQLDTGLAERLALVADLRRAIRAGELLLYCQPKLDLADETINAVEMLVRWRHPYRGMVPPGEFIPLAEQTGLIDHLTEWVLDRTISQLHSWRQSGLDVQAAVNLSAVSLSSDALLNRVVSLLKTWEVPADRLVFELTETAIMGDPGAGLSQLRRIAAAGIEIHIDDFGTGYSSLSYLQRLPASTIKIDRQFVARVLEDAGDEAIIRSVVALAHSLDRMVVAEGVETPAQLERLSTLGCDAVQGYLVSRPMDVSGFPSWVAADNGRSVRHRIESPS